MGDPPLCITSCPPPSLLVDRSRSGSIYPDDDIREQRATYWKNEVDVSMVDYDTPELLFQKCGEKLGERYPPLESDAAVPRREVSLKELEQRIADTCAADIARMQTMKSMYTEYRNFVFLHGGEGRDRPSTVRDGEVRSRGFQVLDDADMILSER